MTNILISLFCINIILFIYIFFVGLFYNFFLLKNKKIIEQYFSENGYKLYIYDKEQGKILSRHMRLKLIETLVRNSEQIGYKKLLLFFLKLYKSLYYVFAIIFFISVAIVITFVFYGRR